MIMMKTVIRIYLILAFIFTALESWGQTLPPGTVTQPTLGYVVDGAHHLRPMIGVVGAASIGDALDVGMDVISATVPPAHDYVLATTSGGAWPVMLQVRGGAFTIQPGAFAADSGQAACSGSNDSDLPSGTRSRARTTCSQPASIDISAAIDQIALSPTGSAAAFYASSAGQIYSFANVNQSPSFSGQFQVGSLGALSAFGVSDDGKTVAVGVSDGQSGSLFIANAGRPMRLIASMAHPAAIVFLHNSSNAIVADDVANTVSTIWDGQVFPIASSQDGISQPTAIGTSNDDQRVFVGSSQTGSVITVGPNGTISQPMPCNCTLRGLFPTNTDSVFRLTDFTGGPVLLFDAKRAAPRITFVPVRSSQF
jgi:hypothetical protein